MHDRDADVVIIGAGLAGLECAYILASEGMRVCVLEKNAQLGGSLQVFSRDKTLFDTGVHYIGGLDPGQNMHRYFSYFGIMDGLKLHRMDPDGFDRITFSNDPNAYPIAQGRENFVQCLLPFFPKEEKALRTYLSELQRMCDKFPLYYLRYEERDELTDPELRLNARDHIASITQDPVLRNVLGASNVLHAGDPARTPFHLHAQVLNSYIDSAYRCVDGGSRIAKLLARNARAHGAVIHARKHVTRLELKNGNVHVVHTADGDAFTCKTVICNAHPMAMLSMLDRGDLRPATRKRLSLLENTISSFTLHLVMEPGSFPYLDHNHYHFHTKDVWDIGQYAQGEWPDHFMLFTPLTSRSPQWAEGVSVMAFMRFAEVAEWAGSYNTIAEPGARDPAYTAFKKQKEEALLRAVERRHPHIRKGIRAMHSSTPLTMRDFLGAHEGTTYGLQKDDHDPLRVYVSPRTKVPNLLLTGQNVNVHGILGVTVSAVLTCSELLGKEYLVRKIQAAS